MSPGSLERNVKVIEMREVAEHPVSSVGLIGLEFLERFPNVNVNLSASRIPSPR